MTQEPEDIFVTTIVARILEKWKRAFDDNLISEQGAIKQYGSQADEFDKDLKIITVILQRYETKLPVTFSTLLETLVEMIDNKKESLSEIKKDEEDHASIFTKFISKLEKGINNLKVASK